MNGPLHPDDLPDDLHEDAAVDPIDELLRARLQAGAPGTTSTPEAQAELVELTPRFRRARQRRQAAVAALSSAAAVVLVVVGLAAFGDEGSQRIDTAGDDTSTSLTTSSSTSTTSTTAVPSTTTPSTSTTAPSTTAPVPGAVASTTTTTPSRPTVAPSVAAPTTPVGGTETLAATGGTATVRWTATNATVLGATPAPGWTVERSEQKSATRVEVRFRRDDGGSGSSSSTIDARVVDGRLVVDAS